MKKFKGLAVILLIVIVSTFLFGCEYYTDKGSKWKTEFDISLPDFSNAGKTKEDANENGWWSTLLSEFDDGKLGDEWRPLANSLRREEYWCDQMVAINDGKVFIDAKEISDHDCDNCGDESTLYTSGIGTFYTNENGRQSLFEQAFGYYEATVKLPDSDGMWSAFWLNTNGMSNVGSKGEDGSEIDIYESSFYNKKSYVGNCIHYDGYGKSHKGGMATHDVGYNLYEGYHTFGLKWTPNEYVFYVDNVAVWATNFGGVSKVPSYLLLTNEVRQKNKVGPYGQHLGKFTGGTFIIESVKVYQNINYLDHIRRL